MFSGTTRRIRVCQSVSAFASANCFATCLHKTVVVATGRADREGVFPSLTTLSCAEVATDQYIFSPAARSTSSPTFLHRISSGMFIETFEASFDVALLAEMRPNTDKTVDIFKLHFCFVYNNFRFVR